MNTFLFDLDGTLLPLEQEKFVEAYFSELSKKCISMGYKHDIALKAVIKGVKAMLANDGSVTNKERFWGAFEEALGNSVISDIPEFMSFYTNEFRAVKGHTYPTELARECIKELKNKGYSLILATNPLFPAVGTYERMRWAGLDKEDFIFISTYENSSYCKPNLRYYRSILEIIGKSPDECIMVGNDVMEDMCVTELNMDTFLLTDFTINPENKVISVYRNGSFSDLLKFVRQLPKLN